MERNVYFDSFTQEKYRKGGLNTLYRTVGPGGGGLQNTQQGLGGGATPGNLKKIGVTIAICNDLETPICLRLFTGDENMFKEYFRGKYKNYGACNLALINM